MVGPGSAGKLGRSIFRARTHSVAAMGARGRFTRYPSHMEASQFLCRPGGRSHYITFAMACNCFPAFAVFVPNGYFRSWCSLQRSFRSWGLLPRQWAGIAAVLIILVLRAQAIPRSGEPNPICYREADIQHERPRGARPSTGGVDQIASTNFYIADVFGPARRRAGAGGDSPATHHQRRQSSSLEYPLDPDAYGSALSPIPHRTPIMPLGSRAIQYGKRRATTTSSALVEIHTTGQSPAAIFQGRTSLPAQGSTR